MPVYRYHCDGCGEDFERFVPRVARGDAGGCPHCASREVREVAALIAVARVQSRTAARGLKEDSVRRRGA
jgi:putative FmdB family regulatory protein